MKKLFAYFQLLLALLCAIVGGTTLVNLFFIVQRPETISVVNSIIGLGVLIIAFFALARLLLSKGLKGIKMAAEPSATPDSPDT